MLCIGIDSRRHCGIIQMMMVFYMFDDGGTCTGNGVEQHFHSPSTLDSRPLVSSP